MNITIMDYSEVIKMMDENWPVVRYEPVAIPRESLKAIDNKIDFFLLAMNTIVLTLSSFIFVQWLI